MKEEDTRDKMLKVCFVLDCTASMTPWIHAAKNKVLDLLEDLEESHKNFKIYAAFIGYRDFGEQWYHVNFTENSLENYMQLHDTIMRIHALGGGDEAEDVAGAYKHTVNLDWNTADVKAVFHIGDAPNHGLLYHDNKVGDDYPQGTKTDLRTEVRFLAANQIDLTVFRLNKSTDIMFKIMKDCYDEVRPKVFKIVNFVNSNETEETTFYREISSQLQTSMSMCDSTE